MSKCSYEPLKTDENMFEIHISERIHSVNTAHSRVRTILHEKKP